MKQPTCPAVHRLVTEEKVKWDQVMLNRRSQDSFQYFNNFPPFDFKSDKKYVVIQCTGYLKSWAPAKIGLDEQQQESSECDPDSYNLSCLVAVGRILQNPLIHHSMNSNSCIRSIQFLSRHAMDGKFLFVDQR